MEPILGTDSFCHNEHMTKSLSLRSSCTDASSSQSMTIQPFPSPKSLHAYNENRRNTDILEPRIDAFCQKQFPLRPENQTPKISSPLFLAALRLSCLR